MKPISPNTVIHVPTKELDQQVCKIFDDAGLKTIQGKSYIDPKEKRWDVYKDKTCYNPSEGKYGYLEYYEANGFKSLPAEEFIKMNEVDEERELLVGFIKWHWPAANINHSIDKFLEEKRKPKFSLICADGVEVNDPEQEVWVVYMDNVHGTLALTKNVNNRALYFSAKSAAQLHLKKTILEKNGISKEDCEMIFKPN